MSTPLGSDGRPLVTTDMAAYSMGLSPKRFRDWARRRGITPAGTRPNPNRGQALALWDLADIARVLRQAGQSADTTIVR
ncbi:hypothetical protein AB0F46_18615 [Streptomyces sp. NPDC026665]|uniref:hypothetical protein n=1 Tax=Streptomyces sp. NPDC026665 TaxID=3154798 RepID=UPI0033C49983